MQTMNQSLLTLYQRRIISFDDAMARSGDPEELKQMMAGLAKPIKKGLLPKPS
jgi:twitching motility protein PilT